MSENATDNGLRERYFELLLAGEEDAAARVKEELFSKAKFLYRYRPISEFGLNELITGRTYLARPEDLNDPYECRILLNPSGYPGTKLGSAWSALHATANDVRCASFCEDPGLVLMWAHYANRPRGCCLEFQIENLRGVSNITSNIHPVIYANQLYDANAPLQTHPERLKDILTRMACHKLEPWGYEREWRLLSLEITDKGAEWGGPPMSAWAPKFKFEEQSKVIGYLEEGRRFIDLPAPNRVIFWGEKMDPALEQKLRGIKRLSGVTFALAQMTPDAEPGKQLFVRDL